MRFARSHLPPSSLFLSLVAATNDAQQPSSTHLLAAPRAHKPRSPSKRPHSSLITAHSPTRMPSSSPRSLRPCCCDLGIATCLRHTYSLELNPWETAHLHHKQGRKRRLFSPIGEKLSVQHLGQQAANLFYGHLLAADGFFLVILVGRGLHADVRKLGWE